MLSIAQSISFTAQAPRQVAVGQQFQIAFTLNAEGTGFISPEIQHFVVLTGPMTQTGQNIFNNNGKIEYTSTTSYIYVLLANETGTFTIPSAVITSNGKRYMSNKLTITVVNQGAKQGQQQRGTMPQSQPEITEDAGKDIFLKAVVSNSNPYQGEQTTVVYKLYTPTNRLQIGQAEKIPSYQGFWAQDLMKDATQYTQYQENIGGRRYIVVELRKAALFPQKSGTLTIEPLVQNVIYQVKVKGRNPFADDPFFGNDPFFKNMMDDAFAGTEYQNVSKTLHSNALQIQVKPLQSAGKPIDFSGAVGHFEMKAAMDKTKLLTNDAATFRITISGNGNMNLLEKPVVSFPPDFEVYDPKIIDNFRNGNGISGTRTYEFLVIPRTAGNFTIEPVRFSYFDLVEKDYKTLFSEKFNLEVNKGSGRASADADLQSDVKMINSDIRYLRSTPLALMPAGKIFFGSWLFFLLLLLPILAFLAFVILWRKNMKLRGDINRLQQLKATKTASKRLRKAKKLLDAGQTEAFHEEISMALWGYVSHKFNVPLADLSLDTARNELEKRNVQPDVIERFTSLLAQCNYARYAPKDNAMNINELYNISVKAITETEQNLR